MLQAPLAHPGGAGLLWAIQGGRLVELHRDWAVIELAANGSRHVFERRRVDAGNVTIRWNHVGRRPGDAYPAHPESSTLSRPVPRAIFVELHRDWAVIELAANGSRHVFDRRRVDAGNV